ncbi:hypothetical protein [Pseudomonas violetae]|uniref:Lipoprotein n=1 Tax=Pseudomonas violetae TaxID=2915813 RepID=A0ABT0F7L4_9PSED|nr:hypothetical protein [Pseudomonas violetae]MCK1793599.1 hypothetical protein [Pseudomonas violetae]
MKNTQRMLLLAVSLIAANNVQADDSPMQTQTYNSEFNYYGTDQPFAHPSPPSISTVPPGSYISTSPRDFIPIASQHEFSDSRLPTIADASVRVFIRSYDPERGVYVNEEVLDPTCLLACLSRQRPAL